MRTTSLNGAAAGAMIVALGLGASACSTPVPGGGSALSASDSPAARLEALVALDRRVAAVGFRLTTASVDLCASRRDVAGWTLHAANQYSDALRPVAEARFGLDGDLPGVLAVADDSPAARASLAAGDLLVDPSDEYNARADGRGVFISSTMAAYAADDDDLALILGHELAHNVLQHHPSPEPLGDPDPVPETALARGNHWTQERDADRVGLFLAARAGFDTARAPGFLRRFGADNWRIRYAQIGHASAEARARALEETNAEIAAQRAAGRPLRP